jgi:diguanylate cyclase (GGDEF)-like protein
MRILIVDDDSSITSLLASLLSAQNYVIDIAEDGETGWSMAEVVSYDLILLDVGLPKLDGITFCRRLRDRRNQVLVMLLTARDTTTDKLLGLDSGADDYVVKPFDVAEVAARIRALLRRGTVATSPVLEWGNLKLDPRSREVTYQGQLIAFSRKEYLLIELFLRNQQRVFSRSEIIDKLWSFGEDPPTEDTVKSHVKSIRQKLRSAGIQNMVETVYGQGYRVRPCEEDEVILPKTPKEETPPSTVETLDAVVAQIWIKNQSTTLDKIAALEQIIQQILMGFVDPEISQQAHRIAHQLAGALGTFGLDDGSRVARELEQLFDAEPAHLEASAQKLLECAVTLRQIVQAAIDRPLHHAPVEQAPPLPVIASDLLEVHQILIVEANSDSLKSLLNESTGWGVRVEVASDAETALQHIQQRTFQGIMVNVAFFQKTYVSPLMDELSRLSLSIPVIIWPVSSDTSDRLVFARLKGHYIVENNQTPSHLFQIMMCAMSQSMSTAAKILAVDDDSEILALLQQLLEPHGITFQGLADPLQFWPILEAVQPDLVILDIDMANVDGLELCRLIRDDSTWNWLPILFLTAANDATTIQKAFIVGADDYLEKPIDPEYFTMRLFNRLRRSQQLRYLAETDTLTGVLNQQHGARMVEQLLHRATLAREEACFILIQLDSFQQISAEYGDQHGDRLLRQFAQFLRYRIRSTDILSRWHHDVFALGMYSLHHNDAIERIQYLLMEWQSQVNASNVLLSRPLNFKIGVAQYPVAGTTIEELSQSAESALRASTFQPISSTSSSKRMLPEV